MKKWTESYNLGDLHMTKYEKLLIKAEEIGIRVREIDFGTDEECGYYHNNKILINSRLNNKQKYGVLAEELGHHYTTFGDITDQSKVRNKKQELIARRYGYKCLIEPNDIIEAVRNGANTIYEIADYLDITVKTLDEVIKDYKKQYGIGVLVGNYYLQLEPTLGVLIDFGGLLKY